MAGKPKPQEEESGEGAPLWIISFADMISLLMAFFVMLTTFSGFGPKESAKLRKVINVGTGPKLLRRMVPESLSWSDGPANGGNGPGRKRQ